jgi:hypothetical protein
VKNVDKQYRYDVNQFCMPLLVNSYRTKIWKCESGKSPKWTFMGTLVSENDMFKRTRFFCERRKLKLTELGKSLKDEGKKEKAIETAKIAIKKGMDNETISELTGLSIGNIELIRKVLKQ